MSTLSSAALADPAAFGHAQVEAAAAFLRDRLGAHGPAAVARMGVVLGSGLGKVADGVLEGGGRAVDYAAIPHFQRLRWRAIDRAWCAAVWTAPPLVCRSC